MGGNISIASWRRHTTTGRRSPVSQPQRPRPRRVAIVVLGDVGRSPRMQYHALSLASHGVDVCLLGYSGEKCFHDVENNARITPRRFHPPLSGPKGKALRKRSYFLFAALKALSLTMRLLIELIALPRSLDTMLVQNPPALPALFCVYVVAVVRRCHLMVDWHNLGFTMFDGCGPRNPLVLVTRAAEWFFCQRADFNICVSRAMQKYIMMTFQVSNAYIVYDQPPVFFQPPTLSQRHDLFMKLLKIDDFARAAQSFAAASTSRAAAEDSWGSECSSNDDGDDYRSGNGVGTESNAVAMAGCRAQTGESNVIVEELTPFTRRRGKYATLRADRPALLVSSTSWTPDEDFSILLDALSRLELRVSSGAAPSLPYVIVIVTGKGPQREAYIEKIKGMKLSWVSICTAWLEPLDYPLLLGAADLGVCLHTSTSGMDLPMKVVDMFGCGLPVCAVHYDTLNELVRDGYNGCTFKDGRQLAMQLEALLEGHPRAGGELAGYRANVEEVKRWAENWDKNAWPLFEATGGPRNKAKDLLLSMACWSGILLVAIMAWAFLPYQMEVVRM